MHRRLCVYNVGEHVFIHTCGHINRPYDYIPLRQRAHAVLHGNCMLGKRTE